MRLAIATAVFLILASPAFASVSVKKSSAKAKTIDVVIEDESLSSVVKAINPHLAKRVQLLVTGDPHVNYSATRVAPEAALRGIAEAAKATVTMEKGSYWLRNIEEPSVTLDVKDQDIRTTLKQMQKQCRLKNLVLDPEVQGTATFLFDKLPCGAAFGVVFRTMGLAYVDYGNSVVSVGPRKR